MSMRTHKPFAKMIERFLYGALAASTLSISLAVAQAPPPLAVSEKPQVTPPKDDSLLKALTPELDVVYGAPLEQQHGFLRDLASRIK